MASVPRAIASPRAPALTRWVLERTVDRHYADLVLGDLYEELTLRARAHGRHSARRWYRREALHMALGFFHERLRARLRAWLPVARRSGGSLAPVPNGGFSPMNGMLQDVRLGVRQLFRYPGFSVVAIVTLALGVGATAAVFGAVDGILLAPLPYEAPERLAIIEVNTGGTGFYGSSMPEYFDYVDYLKSFEGTAGFVASTRTISQAEPPRRAPVAFVTEQFFDVLGVEPQIGRTFSAEESAPGNFTTAVISHSLWQSQFGGGDDIVGATLVLSGTDVTIIGVMPASFQYPSATVEAWVPAGWDREAMNSRANHYIGTVGRLAEGATVASLGEEAAALAQRSIERYPENYSERGYATRVSSLHESVIGSTRAPLNLLMVTATLVLLVACGNVANLLLSRTERRRVEVAVRAALGAGRARIVRQLLTESALLAAAGGLAGLGVAALGVRAFQALAPDSVPRIADVALDARVVGFALAVALGTTLLFGLLPALQAGRTDLRATMGAGGRGAIASRRARLVRQSLVVAQVAMAAVLALGAVLMIQTLANLENVDKGFDPDNVLTLRATPVANRYPTAPERVDFYDRLLAEIEAVPGVERAAASTALPMVNGYAMWSLVIDGIPTSGIGDAPDAWVQIATPGYFETLRTRLVAGRLFDETDTLESEYVVVANEAMVAKFWPDVDPLQQRLRMFPEGNPFSRVVGVVANEKYLSLDEEPQPRLYFPYAQSDASAYTSPSGLNVMVRTAGDPQDVAAAVRAAIGRVDADMAISRFQTHREAMASTVAVRGFTTALLQGFGVVALLLACVGIYGVLATIVGEQRQEIGLRKALGQADSAVLTGVLRSALMMAAVGLLLGGAAGIATGPWLQSLIYGVGPGDPAPLALVGAGILLVVTLAALVPGLRATRVDPAVALRAD